MNDYAGDDLESLAGLKNYQSWIMSHFQPYLRGRALEIGAGIGTFSEQFLPHLSSIELLEPSPKQAAKLTKKFNFNQNVAVYNDMAENHLLNKSSERYDVIIMINVLEHISEDGKILRLCRDRLTPGGNLLVFVPALPFLFSRMDRLLGHHRRYTAKGLRTLISQSEFDIHLMRYFDISGILPWWLTYTLGKRDRFDYRLAILYDRTFVPMGRFMESVIHFPAGKNIIAVGSRR